MFLFAFDQNWLNVVSGLEAKLYFYVRLVSMKP